DKHKWLSQAKKGFLRYRDPYETISHLRAAHCDFSSDYVTIGREDELCKNDLNAIKLALQSFIPWRKGPFNVFGIEIDAEWRSERKWNRILPHLPDLTNKIIGDIGCNNGYYMFRMAHSQPRFVLGFEPVIQHYYTFKTLNSLANLKELTVELLGVENLNLFPDSFDVLFLMGIIYHRHSPIDVLRNIHDSLKPGGTLILESQAIPGEQAVALFPDSTYAKAPGNWFIPTGACLQNWLSRTGFRKIDLFYRHPMSSMEQRKTDWMLFESYEDFIDKNNSNLTIEGYPAPWRVFIKATK
ncbi:MAG: tRNA 5-methoxyuridine(34)/uridine 5-oxyacetic acid(34) synthase CmoB, partial [Desulfobulbaceae bacterium]|nr:tRNA 5-methoxyuridine(34)/uridine 5-oxyacetic acid(34) synthase CmoB [Desulfobulbaceae bacterium]